jgi:ribulose bisphosphate carboxylase small subunit
MTTLRDARNGDMEKFIKEHEADPEGDLDKLDTVIKRPNQGTVSEAPKASSQVSDDD